MKSPTLTKRMRPWMPGVLLALAAGCAGEAPHGPRTVGPAVIPLAMSADLRRPAVEYDHAHHQKVLEIEGCETCHPKNEKEELSLLFMRLKDPDDPDDLMDLYHLKCMDCHVRREESGQKGGPLGCGDCHRERGAVISARQPVIFDYLLHHRHLEAAGEECGACHHVYDQDQKKLVYQEGQESACRDCHGEVDDGRTLSLRNASHTDCIACHRDKARETAKTGPWTCLGCHQAKKKKASEAPPEIPRLKRNQPDRTWIHAEGARARMVAFDHVGHEPQTRNCSTCHHQTLKACKQCHRLMPVQEGGGVNLEAAYHLATSDHSCVGCHRREMGQKECAGCHQILSEQPSERACKTCHRGPEVRQAGTDLPPPEAWEVALAELPPTSEAFPDEILIDVLAKKFKPSSLPHRKIVEALDRRVRKNKLATSFHESSQALCAGCHHNSPVGVRPSPCRSCHDDKGLSDRDQPDLFSAYHRQCVGCHQRMEIEQQGCTDCHQEVSP